MKNLTLLLLLIASAAFCQTNTFPSSGNAKIFAVGESWAEGLAVVRASGWSGVRLTRNDPAGGNYNGNWALGYNGSTGNDFSISTNYLGTQYDGLFHISNSTRYVGIGTTQPNNPLSIKGRVAIRADANPNIAGEALHVEGGILGEENVVNVTNLVDQDFLIRLSGVGAGVKRTLIGPSSTTRFSLGLGVNSGNEYLTLVNGGNVGIGTVTPSQKLDVNGNINIAGAAGRRLFMGGVGGTTFGIAYDANNPNYGMFYTEAAVDYISLSPNGNANNGVMNIYGDGAVGIGTTTPGNFKLAVNGKIWGTEVQVALTNPGPDYVFEKSYTLPTLEEVKSYIDQNKHLPEVPSAKEMEANGVNVGEMNMLLLKKIEELTLYVIEIKKENEKLKSEVNKINSKIK
jgi:hypothetical protein